MADGYIPEGSWIDQHPPHPGEAILHDCLGRALGVSEAVQRLAVSRKALARVLKGTAPVTARLALRLEEQGWPNAEFWLRLQAPYDLAWSGYAGPKPPDSPRWRHAGRKCDSVCQGICRWARAQRAARSSAGRSRD